jgi:tryptophanyl-tRNA synthetase
MRRLLNAPDEIDALMARGAERAAAVAEPILAETFRIMGFVR